MTWECEGMPRETIFDEIANLSFNKALDSGVEGNVQSNINKRVFGSIRLHGLSALKIASEMCDKPVNVCEMAEHYLNFHMANSGLDSRSANSYCSLQSVGFARARLRDSFLPLCLSFLNGNKKTRDEFMDYEGGSALMEWLCVDENGAISVKMLERQSEKEFHEGLHEFVLKMAPIRNETIDESYSDLVIALSSIYMQGIIENGCSIDHACEIFNKRNRWLLSSLGFDRHDATAYSKHLVSRALFPYPMDKWPTSITLEDMLGVEQYHVMNMDCHEQCLNWLDTPLSVFEHSMFSGFDDNIEEKSFQIQRFNEYFSALSATHLDSRRLFTPGIEFLFKNYSNDCVAAWKNDAKKLISTLYSEVEHIDPSHVYVMNLLKDNGQESLLLMQSSIEWLVAQNFDYSQFSKISLKLSSINNKHFNLAAQSIIAQPNREYSMVIIIPLLDNPSLHIKSMDKSERRAALSQDLSL
jgi:hypothetical protein